jgi:hypothetical protein
MKQETKQVRKQETKKVYKTRVGSPFRSEDAQEIGEFIENCKDKSTRGILEEVKRNPKSKIYSYFEWDKKKAVELYLLQRVREIVSHLEIEIVRIGEHEPINLNVSVSAFKSVQPVNSEERVYVSFNDGMNTEVYRNQIIERAKTELRNWMGRYNQYKELETIIKTLKTLL